MQERGSSPGARVAPWCGWGPGTEASFRDQQGVPGEGRLAALCTGRDHSPLGSLLSEMQLRGFGEVAPAHVSQGCGQCRVTGMSTVQD